MTARMPDLSIWDQILKFMGKQRGVRYPVEAYDRFGNTVYLRPAKESFWKALFRSKNQQLPEAYIDLFSFYDLRNGRQSDL